MANLHKSPVPSRVRPTVPVQKMILSDYLIKCIILLLSLQWGGFQATSSQIQNTSSAHLIALCPGEVLIVNCSIIGGGATVWQGTAFHCDSNSGEFISLRHSQFMESNKPEGSCTNGAIIARAIGVVNNSYISELNVTVNLEMNNTTIKCVHIYNLMETIVKEINITVISSDNSQNAHPTDAQLIKVSNGELTFNWNSSIKYCNGYFIESNDCGICPNETYDTHITCKDVSSVSKLCSFTVGASTSNGTWIDQVNITLRAPEAPEIKTVSIYRQDSTNKNEIIMIECIVKMTESFNLTEEIDGSATHYIITISCTAISSHLTSKTVNISSTCFDGKYFSHTFEINSSTCHSSDIVVSVYATNVLGDGLASSSVIGAKNSHFYVDVDIMNDIIFCVLEDFAAEDSLCIIKAIFEQQQGKCNNNYYVLEKSSYAYNNLSIAHLPRNQTLCFVAEANHNSTSTVILVGNFSTPIGTGVIYDDMETTIYQTTVIVAVVVIIIVAAASMVTVYIIIFKRKKRRNISLRDSVRMKYTTSAPQSGSVLNQIWVCICACVKVSNCYSTTTDMNQREVIYADVHVVTAESHMVEMVLDDDRVEYAELNHNCCIKTTNKAISPQKDEATSESYSHVTPCDLDNLLIQLRFEVTSYWYEFGTVIGMDEATLEKYSKYPPEQCLIEVIDFWVRIHDNKPTWRGVSNILKEIKLNKLAEDILNVYETGKLPIDSKVSDMDTIIVPHPFTYEEDEETPPPLPPKA